MIRSSIVLSALTLVLSAGTAEAQVTREVSYNARAVVHLNARSCASPRSSSCPSRADPRLRLRRQKFWIVSGAQNLAYDPSRPRPAPPPTTNLVTASGNVIRSC